MTRLVEASSTFSGFYAAADPYSVRFRTPIGRKVPPSQNGQGHGHEDRIDLGLPRPASSGMVSKVTSHLARLFAQTNLTYPRPGSECGPIGRRLRIVLSFDDIIEDPMPFPTTAR